MTHIDLFSGIGGFALACRWAGIETIQFVEIDPFCQKVLKKNFPEVPIHDDIKTFKYTGATPFILTGGFPCQPFSCAGKRRGKEDDRYLWPEMLRVISEAKPTWIVGENVGGFINMGLDDCISDLEAQDYEVQAFIVPACAVNAPHRRDRVWIVANSRGRGCSRQDFCNEQQGRSKIIGTSEGLEYRSEGLSKSDCHVADSDTGRIRRYERKGVEEGSASCGSEQCDAADARCIRPEKSELQPEGDKQCNKWLEPWLEAATRLCRVDDGVSNRVHRLKALGNAIVPQVAFQIIKAIVEIEGDNNTDNYKPSAK